MLKELQRQQQEEEVLLPVWMIYCLFTELMEAATAAWNVGVKIRTILHNRGCDDGETTQSHLAFTKLWF